LFIGKPVKEGTSRRQAKRRVLPTSSSQIMSDEEDNINIKRNIDMTDDNPDATISGGQEMFNLRAITLPSGWSFCEENILHFQIGKVGPKFVMTNGVEINTPEMTHFVRGKPITNLLYL
jgi:hypothetical protein